MVLITVLLRSALPRLLTSGTRTLTVDTLTFLALHRCLLLSKGLLVAIELGKERFTRTSHRIFLLESIVILLVLLVIFRHFRDYTAVRGKQCDPAILISGIL